MVLLSFRMIAVSFQGPKKTLLKISKNKIDPCVIYFGNCMGISFLHTLLEFSYIKILLKDLDNLHDVKC